MQLRLYPIIITADIETTYLQINIEEEHRDYLRLIWFTNLFDDGKVKVCKYRFTRVILEQHVPNIYQMQQSINTYKNMLT